MRSCPVITRVLNTGLRPGSRHHLPWLPNYQWSTIRQTSYSKVNARPLSSTHTSNDSYTAISEMVSSLVHKDTQTRKVELTAQPVRGTGTQSSADDAYASAVSSTYKRCRRLISQNKFNLLISFVKHSLTAEQKNKLQTSELIEIVSLLESMRLSRYIIELYHIFPTQFHETPPLLHSAMEAAYRKHDFALFDLLFGEYIQKPTLEPKCFNMALSVFLKTDTEFAKQLLHQMVFSDYPMDNNTLYIFIKTANRVAIFPTVKFAFDLIKNNPKIPVSSRTYGALVSGFLKGASSREMAQLSAYLKMQSSEECPDVIMAHFLHDLKDCDFVSDVWTKVESFKACYNDPILLERLYEEIYHIFSKRMTVQDLTVYLSLLKDADIEESFKIHKRVLDVLSRNQHANGPLHYLKVTVKRHNIKLDEFYFIALWKSLIECCPDVEPKITFKLRNFIQQNKDKLPWASDALDQLKMDSVNKHHSIIVKSPLFAKRREQIEELTKTNNDRGLMLLVNDTLRAGTRPPIPMLKFVMESLIKLGSPYDNDIYRLIQELYPKVPLDIELILLQKEVKNALQVGRPRPSVQNLIKQFALQHSEKLNTKYYNKLGRLAIDANGYNLAIEFVAKARTSEKYRNMKDSVRIYDTALRALAHVGSPTMFNALISNIVGQEELLLTSELIQNTRRYRKLIIKRLPDEQGKEFKDEFELLLKKLKEKYRKQREEVDSIMKDTLIFLNDWAGPN